VKNFNEWSPSDAKKKVGPEKKRSIFRGADTGGGDSTASKDSKRKTHHNRRKVLKKG